MRGYQSAFISFVTCITVVNAGFVQEFEKFYKKNTAKENLQDSFNGSNWVVLVAGSRSYYNYRHQADVCHAYQVVNNHGIPDDHIIVMMYDDIAYNEENPTPGVIINHPDGPDVYKGVPKDYTKEDVTPKNFLNILTGNATAMARVGSGKVLKSGPKDKVFVYFADHGAPGLIAFPSSELLKDDLLNAINTMAKKRMYGQLVFYVEACESGSMFDGVLPSNINVYATTAADPSESSYACYYDEKRMTYLGDRYSVSWLEDSDKENLKKERLETQFEIVKRETNESHVMQYGDQALSKEVVGLFQGEATSQVSYRPLRAIRDDVPSPDVKIHILDKRIQAASDPTVRMRLKLELTKEMEMRRRIDWTTDVIAQQAASGNIELLTFSHSAKPMLRDMKCYRAALQLFDSLCFELSDYEYAYRRLFVLGNLCDTEAVPTSRVLDAIRATCS